MAYTTISKPSLYFNTKLWNGNGSTNAITGIGFQPDMVWNKARSGGNVNDHRLIDAVRGATKNIYPNSQFYEETDANGLTAFNTDGFTMGNSNGMNNSSTAYVSWTWKANGAGSANTDGTINTTSTSVNTTAGLSISTYTGTGSNATIGHGLGVAPAMILIKDLDENGYDWMMYHQSRGATKYIRLNLNNAEGTSSVWQNTAPTNQVFSVVSNSSDVNKSGNDFVAYCFAEKKGYSKFGSYVGNGNADGTFIYTGFKPALVILKDATSVSNWMIYDNKREGYNVDNDHLKANNTDAEGTSDDLDILSNGFKLRTSGNGENKSSATFIYMALAAEPLVANVGNSIPATAR